jgi:hypothetical protein
MKALQEMPKTFDRMSTREELHQVLDLLSEPGRPWVADALRATRDGENENEDAVATVCDLWQPTAGQPQEVLAEVDSWTELLVTKPERVN